MTRLRRARDLIDTTLSQPGITRREGSVVGARLWEVVQLQELEEARLIRGFPGAAAFLYDGQPVLAPPA